MRGLPFRKLNDVLSATLGAEKSEEVLAEAAQHLEFATDKERELDAAEVERLLTHLSGMEGVVGLAAQFAWRRVRVYFNSDRMEDRAEDRPAAPVMTLPPSPHHARADLPSRKRLSVRSLVDMFAPTLGEAKSEETVRDVLKRERLPEESLDREQALHVLSVLVESPGLVGVAVRFGKARLILWFA